MWCTTECWDCEDRKCEHYISKTELYFENQRLKDKLQQKENIIKEVREYVNTDKNCIPKHIKDYINNLLDKENK